MTLIFATAFSALLYRIGGMSKEDGKKAFPWLPAFFVNTKARDLGCPTVFCLFLLSQGIVTWWLAATFFAMFGGLVTYWDRLPPLWGEEERDLFFIHGLVIGLSAAFLLFGDLGVKVAQVLAYSLILAVFMGLLNWLAHEYHWPRSDWIEELGRGAIIILASPILL